VDVNPATRPDDPESPDADPVVDEPGASTDGPALDVTPRTSRHARDGARNRRGMVVALGLVAVVVIGLGLVLFNGLQDASTFFYNVDEAVARQDDLGGDRFRMQGNVVDGSVERTDEGVSFVITYGGQDVEVDHVGDPPELFGPEIPVVLEGRFQGDRFASDEILIRHDNTYDEENPDRIREAEQDVERQQAGGSAG
jgi:cytochrome c-type biogenesis protein CcmE